MPSLASLVRLVLPRRCAACRAAGRVDVRRLRPAACARSRPRCARAAARPTALAVAACRACSRLRWFTTARSALWLGRPGARARRRAGSAARSHPARLAAALMVHELPRPRGRRDRRRARRARPPAAARRRPARGARAPSSARWWELPVVPLVRRTRDVRPQRGLDATRAPRQRARRVRRPRRPAPPGARRRRLHDRRHRRRVRPRAAPGGRRAGARDHARAHAPRSDLCARAAPWQTPC